MSLRGQTARILMGVLLLTLASFSFSSCGGTGTDLAGGGSSGTGVSTGSITGFGSVVMNGAHYLTDNKTTKKFMGMDNSSMMDNVLFHVGMVVTIHHGPNDHNAQQIEYQGNLQGPIAAKNSGAENTVTILGQTVVVSDADFANLNLNEIAEVSGFVDSAGRIRASYMAMVPCSMMMGMCTASEFEVKGFVSGPPSSGGFRLGPLPGWTGTTVAVSFSPTAGLADGMYVQVVTKNAQPASGSITATQINKLTPRTVFPENAVVDLEGLVTAPPSGSGNALSFALEGKLVQTNGATHYFGGEAANIHPDVRVQVQGTENGGVLSAGNIIFR